MEVTPTNEPAIIDNLKTLVRKYLGHDDISMCLHIYSQITKAASASYFKAIENEDLDPSVPLNYREMALSDSLSPLIEEYKVDCPLNMKIQINDKGLASLSYKPALKNK
jgi:hypothetical protein